jgi:hypothetical protein
VTRKLLKRLRIIMSDATIFKLNDYYSSGIPDFIITINSLSTWFEIKVHPNKPTQLQAYYLERLKPRAFLITFSNDGKFASINDFTTIYQWGSIETTIKEISLKEKL